MTDLTKLSVVALRQELKKAGLATGGKKEELIRRLQDNLDSESLSEAVEAEPSSDAPEAVTVNKLNVSATLLKGEAGTPTNTPINNSAPVSDLSKSVSQNGNGVALDAVSANLREKAEAIGAGDESKPVSGLSLEERLKLRQQRFNTIIKASAATSNQSSDRAAERRAKFGIPADSDAKCHEKVSQRHAKFGTAPKESNGEAENVSKRPAVVAKVDPEVLRKRKEKFGGLSEAASKKLDEVELDEKKRKRLEKFNFTDSVDKRAKTEA
ncbi:hypothetical protein BJ742DRAFT_330850 [Cladochytrium replicatum]|nr:hypothetical protein BJ742DRAFT_330850 [Cladochytrium replicatum]